ncbi:SDR family oxidoreductase [Streptomyces sp. NPDC005438]|uniref:SDR family oxidoreductase n=1 Tax=Streptomyces sp. NPDC005438 TaxID=3156880 RepID=UPI0033B7E819
MGRPLGRERWVRSGEVDLLVEEYGADGATEEGEGSRPTVVLVHGYPDDRGLWSAVVGPLSRHCHVVTYDVRGCGRSTPPSPLRGGFTLERLTDDFLAVADAVSPHRPVHLVGHDWGSVQGWEFATVARTRGRIASFTSISGPSLDHLAHWTRDRRTAHDPRRLAQLLGQSGRSWYVHALRTPRLPELFWRSPLGRETLRLVGRRDGTRPDEDVPRPEDRQHNAAVGVWLYRDNVAARYRDPRPDAHAHVPVQLVVPTRDPYLGPHLYDDLDRWAPRLLRRTVACGHWVPRQRPDQLTRWIRQFTRAHHPRPPRDQSADPLPPPASAAPEGGAPDPDALPTDQGRATQRFAGQLVLVTGAAHGIGAATALAFARSRARVVVVDLDGAGAERTAREARALGAEAYAERVDVGDEEAMERLAERVADRHGVVDVLVNNAGLGMAGPLLETTVEDWRRLLDTNLWGVIHGSTVFGRQMVRRGQGGHIVNIASAAAYLPTRALPAYSTSKAAVLMFSQCLGAELAGRDIGVSVLCPGIVDSGITQRARFVGTTPSEEAEHRRRTTRAYARRAYPPRRVAHAVLRAVLDGRPMVPVTPEARVAWWLSRLSPGALRALARISP